MSSSPYKITITDELDFNRIQKGIWVYIAHASRTPPHIGLIIDSKAQSLEVKGTSVNVGLNVVLKNCRLRKIKTIFIKIEPHPVFSNDYLKEYLIEIIKSLDAVGHNNATCLSPIKEFFAEFYPVKTDKVEFIFDLLPELFKHKVAKHVMCMNLENDLDNATFTLPFYSKEELNDKILETKKYAKLTRKENNTESSRAI